MDQYERLTEIEHILRRPTMYVGNNARLPRHEVVFDLETGRMTETKISVPEAVERIFLEILSNASDNVMESRKLKIPPGKIEVLMGDNVVSIRNGGHCIPVQIHPEWGIYVPQALFGELRCSSNFKDHCEGIGQNGLGAKLCNVFSKRFTVAIGNPDDRLEYVQTWRNSTSEFDPPSIKPYKGEPYVQITYEMDFSLFGYTETEDGEPTLYDQETYNLFARHCLNVSFTEKIPVKFCELEFNLADPREYAKLYFDESFIENSLLHYEWPDHVKHEDIIRHKNGIQTARDSTVVPVVELCILDTPDQAQVVSFVNSMITRQGGVHVDATVKAVSSKVIDSINSGKKTKGQEKKRSLINVKDVTPHLSMILSCHLVNPRFESQTKTKLNQPTPKLTLEGKFIDQVMKWKLVDRLFATLEAKEFANLQKTDGKRGKCDAGPDYIKANDTESSDWRKRLACTLFVVEGKSAQAYAISMISQLPGGSNLHGCFPLKGKPLNVRNVGIDKIIENKELSNLKSALKLREGVDYTQDEEYATMRYGKVVLLADADDDGKHILGLMLNYFHCRFPSLLERGIVGFIRTPLLKVSHGKIKHKFFTMGEYLRWKDETRNPDSWTHEYFKGLASSSKKDLMEDIKDLRTVQCDYDFERDTPKMDLAFFDKLADNRKTWIADWIPHYELEETPTEKISDFIDQELVQYSIANLRRCIPHLMDGFKVSLRKIVWTLFKKFKIGKPNDKLAVERLAAAVAEYTAYHHGTTSLSEAIIGMAQSFVGANNLPLLNEDGQFGTRFKGGKDAGAPRYCRTTPSPWIQYIFRKEDFSMYVQEIDDGVPVEPAELFPIIPLQLVNGSNGIATGHSTFIPQHHPLDVVNWLRKRIRGEETPLLMPWYRGFTGEIKIVDTRDIDPSEEVIPVEEEETDAPRSRSRFSMVTRGTFECLPGNKIMITELPIGRWTVKYKEWLEILTKERVIKRFKNFLNDEKVRFEIEGFAVPTINNLKLQKSYGLGNMVLLNSEGKPQKYDTVEAIAEAFYDARLPLYERRKQMRLAAIAEKVKENDEKLRYVRAVYNGDLVLIRGKENDIKVKLTSMGIPFHHYQETKGSYFSVEGIARIERENEELRREYTKLEETGAGQLWLNDLEDFEKAYQKHGPSDVGARGTMSETIKSKTLRIGSSHPITKPKISLSVV